MITVTNYSPCLCAGAVVLIANDLSEADRQDSLDALLYSQTVASRKFSGFTQCDLWIGASKSAMKTLGAILSSEPGNSYPASARHSFTLGDLAQETLAQLVSVDAEQALKTCLTTLSLRPLASPESAMLQGYTVQDQKRVQFKFGVISPGISIVFATLSFEFDDPLEGNILNHRFSQDRVPGSLSIEGFKAVVEPEDYELSRETIRSLLGAARAEQIVELT